MQFVSPTQINFQVPRWPAISLFIMIPREFTLEVITPEGTSDPVKVRWDHSVGLFTVDGSGCGQAAALNVMADGRRVLNSTAESVSPGEYVSLFGTGLDATYFADFPKDAEAAPDIPVYAGVTSSRARFGYPEFAPIAQGRLTYSGRAPRLVGIDQYDFQVPEDAPEGCAVPFRIAGSQTARSQPVTLSVRRGGGQCQDQPVSRSGILRWVWRETFAPETPSPSRSAHLSARFYQGAANLVPPVSQTTADDVFGEMAPVPTACPGASAATIDLGPATYRNPRGEASVAAFRNGGYDISVPTATNQAGTHSVTFPGVGNVDGLTANVTIPNPMRFTSLAPGMTIPSSRAFVVTWEDAPPNARIYMRMIARYGYFNFNAVIAQAFVDPPSLTIPRIDIGGRFERFPLQNSEDVTIEIMVISINADGQKFSAPFLDKGGIFEWVQTYTFQGLKIRPNSDSGPPQAP
jgi:uncharacterized protein (TIGR03437 family)